MQEHLVLLRQILTDRFDEEELRTLCFDLGVDYDNLPGRGKAAKARELAAYFERRKQIPECVEVGKQLRPDILWEQVQLAWLETAQQEAAEPQRFQLLIDELRDAVARGEGRVERQRERIAAGLEQEREKRLEAHARRHERDRVQVVGQPPLDVADYFKDRQRELTTLTQMLAQPTTRLISVIGHGGMGKTALACKVLRDIERHRWPHVDEDLPVDGIAYLSTRTAGISLERLFLDCAKLLGGEQEEYLNAVWTNPQLESEEKITSLLKALSDGRHVILLDNLEDLLNDRGQFLDDDLRLFFDQALTTARGARLIVTSRVALTFQREVIRFDRQVELLEGLPLDDGMALLRELDPNGDYGLRDASREELGQAVELTHGMPRALEVLAGILANDPFASLSEVMETFYEQEDVVQALIEENYRRLDQDARRVIEALAVFRKPVPVLAVDYLLEPFMPGMDVPSVVRRLTRTSIVSVDRVAKTVTLHPIDQDYAYSQLPEEDETESAYTRQALERRAADYYIQLRTPKKTWRSIADLEPQLNEFEHRVRAKDYDTACRLLDSIDSSHLYIWGHYLRLVEMREILRGRLIDHRLRVANLGNLGRAYHYLGQLEKAIQLYEELLSIARRIDDRHSESVWLGYLSHTYRVLGEVGRSIETQQQALTIARELNDLSEEGRHLGDLGLAYQAIGRFQGAIQLCRRALDIARETQNHRYQGTCLGRLGLAYHSAGQIDRALDSFGAAISIAETVGERRGESVRIGRLADVHWSQGKSDIAMRLYERGLRIAREIGHRWGESFHMLGLARVLLKIGEPSEAERYCTKARDLEIPETSYRAALILGIVSLYQRAPIAKEGFLDAGARSRAMLEKTPDLWKPRYTLAASLIGRAVCNPQWGEESEPPELLAPALEEYRRALAITAASGVVQDAVRDLELIQAAGIEGLEPVFELLREAEAEPDEEQTALYEDLI
jgi:tetratricopeptide (TPR) repeat protein